MSFSHHRSQRQIRYAKSLSHRPLGGGQCNYTVEASANPQVNTFSITNSLTTLAVRLLVTCFSATCGSGSNPRPPRSVLSDATLARRAAISEKHAYDYVMAGY